MFRNLVKAMVPSAARSSLRAAYERVEPVLYFGWSVECPCCGARYREFLPHGQPVRRNSRCARCDSVERHRLLFLYLRARTSLFSDKLRLLHFAPERVLRRLLSGVPGLSYVTVDYSETADVHMDITNLAIPANTFDAIICIHVLEHIPDDARAMAELHRVLKPGGWAILQVPLDVRREHTYEDFSITSPEDRRLHFGQEDHVRWYGRDYKQRLEKAGFQVSVDDFVRTLSREQAHRYGLSRDEDIYFCRKT